MAGIYEADFAQIVEQLTPPDKRKRINLAFMKVFGSGFQFYHDILFPVYIDSFTGTKYDSTLTYTAGQQVRAKDHGVYEAKQAVPIATDPTTNPDYWLKVLNIWIGVRERAKYNGQKLVLEWGLNKWFDTQFRQPPLQSDIYITNNAIIVNQFVIPILAKNSSSFIPKNSMYGVAGIPKVASALSVNAFTIFVPLAVYDALIPTQPSGTTTDKDNVVRAFADKYVIAGIKYNITPY
jgi:hypothetical protein